MFPNPVPSLSPPSRGSSIHTAIPTPTSSSLLPSQASSVHTPIPTPAPSKILPAPLSKPLSKPLPTAPITPPEESHCPIPLNTTTSETQPLLQYPVTTHSHPSTHEPENPIITNSQDLPLTLTINAPNHHRKTNFLALILCTISLAASLICITILALTNHHGNNPNKKAHSNSPVHAYDNPTLFPPHHHITRARPLTSTAHTEPPESPHFKGIELAILCLVVFIISAIVRVVSYLMSKWGFCFGGDGSEMSEDCFEDEERCEGGKMVDVGYMV
ncbi:hypothetical protein OCU04_002370 [Sclerotinia nivalis]|uniref:Uncharacterized protein n=1 Tax=Sclerotinia nivalis TaxID=352851 RepID=A0A9X0DM42_9HELO|nr:hypothetical protein OCU04_002370 [Sclerotinia nivalis]